MCLANPEVCPSNRPIPDTCCIMYLWEKGAVPEVLCYVFAGNGAVPAGFLL